MRLKWGQATETGKRGGINQDAILSLHFPPNSPSHPEIGLFMVVQGMGPGFGDSMLGSRAAAKTVELLSVELQKTIAAYAQNDKTLIRDQIGRAFEIANTEVPEGYEDDDLYADSKSAANATVAVVIGDRLYLGHVGKNRGYVVNLTHLKQLTHNHTMGQRLVELGKIKSQEASSLQVANVVYGAIGDMQDVSEVQAIECSLSENDILLLCTNGIWDQLSEFEIHTAVMTAATPQTACKQLIALANEHGSEDDKTVIVIKIVE